MKKQQKKEFKQIQNQSQSGRSMVEMLGVLAIIGVLSIGGIAGYRWGMDKHITNQILYEMNLNSAQLAMLLQRGNAEGVTLSLGSPYDEGNFRTVDYGFDYACGEEASLGRKCQYIDETMYSMTATGLPKRVCNMLNDSVFGMAYYYNHTINGDENNECNDTDNTVTVFFDTDTTVEGGFPRPEESETRTPVPEVTEPTTTTVTTTPEITTTEVTTTTVTTTTVTTASGDCSGRGELKYYSGADPNEIGSFCYCEDGYIGERCEKRGENKECTSNTDCGTGQYCYFYKSSECTKQKEKGKCKSNTPDAKVEVNNKEFFVKFDRMSWWSAQNFCERNNKSMASVSDLDCAKDRYCSSDTITKLYKKIKDYFWLSDLYYNNSCYAYRIDLLYVDVIDSPRNDGGYALCVAPKTN